MAKDFQIPFVEYQEPVSIDNTDIYGGAQYFQQTRSVRVGAGGKGFRSTVEDGIWLGAEKFAVAPFGVTPAGFLKATGVNISGTITAISGFIGGWKINPTTITSVPAGVTLDSAGIITVGIIQSAASGARFVLDGSTNELNFFDGLPPLSIPIGTIKAGSGFMTMVANGIPPADITVRPGIFTLQNGTFILEALANDFTLDIGALNVFSINGVAQDFIYNVDVIPSGNETKNLGLPATRWNELHIKKVIGNNNANIIDLSIPARISINQSFLPSATDSLDLGSASNKWRDLHLSRDLFVGGSSSAGTDFTVGRDLFVGRDITCRDITTTRDVTVGRDLKPISSGTKDIGKATLIWREIHVNKILGLGGGNVIDFGQAGKIITNQSYVPSQTNVISLGQANKRWFNIFASDDINTLGDVVIGTGGARLDGTSNSADLRVSKNFVPNTDNSKTCGSAGLRWSDLRSVLINGADYCFENKWTLTENYMVGIEQPGIAILDEEDNLAAFIGEKGIYANDFRNISELSWEKTTQKQRVEMSNKK